ncbi:ADP-ribosyltransferase [Bacillus cereus group sp. BfR-BA-01349]|uniref:ADP-ribosyltransferase n=1 Tax=Bacillus cereus group sp. BfR-BA-01349 TaxID=2920312 RepID=UPI001F58EBEC
MRNSTIYTYKILGATSVISALIMTTPLYGTTVHAANHDYVEEKKNREQETAKDKKEKMKDILQIIVKPDILRENEDRIQSTRAVLEKLPHEVLGIYEKGGGVIHVTDKRLTKHKELQGLEEQVMKDSSGKPIPLASRFVVRKAGGKPTIVIRIEDYAESHTKRKEVYYEIGKALISSTTYKQELMNHSFIQAVEQIRSNTDRDGKELLFSNDLQKAVKLYDKPIDQEFVSEHLEEFEHMFAEGFAQYFEARYKGGLHAYAPAMFYYMKELEQTRFKERYTQIENESGEILQFKGDVAEAENWGIQTFAKWKTNLTVSEKDIVSKYTRSLYDPINEYLRENNGILGRNTKLDKQITLLDAALKKSSIPQTLLVYRRVTEQQFGKDYNWLRESDETLNKEKVLELEGQFKGKTFKQDSYMSTSLVQDPNSSFGNRQSILLEITLPIGTHGAYIAEMSKYPDQLELLINRGYTFKYNKFTVIHPEEVGKKPYLKIDVSIDSNEISAQA